MPPLVVERVVGSIEAKTLEKIGLAVFRVVRRQWAGIGDSEDVVIADHRVNRDLEVGHGLVVEVVLDVGFLETRFENVEGLVAAHDEELG